MRQYIGAVRTKNNILSPLCLFVETMPIIKAVASGNGNRFFWGKGNVQNANTPRSPQSYANAQRLLACQHTLFFVSIYLYGIGNTKSNFRLLLLFQTLFSRSAGVSLVYLCLGLVCLLLATATFFIWSVCFLYVWTLPLLLLSLSPSLTSCAGFFWQSMGARNRVVIGLSYRPARLHRHSELIPWNRFLGSLKV